MTDLKIDYQLPAEVRVSLGNLVAEFTSAQPVRAVRGKSEGSAGLPAIVSALNRFATDRRFDSSN